MTPAPDHTSAAAAGRGAPECCAPQRINNDNDDYHHSDLYTRTSWVDAALALSQIKKVCYCNETINYYFYNLVIVRVWQFYPPCVLCWWLEVESFPSEHTRGRHAERLAGIFVVCSPWVAPHTAVGSLLSCCMLLAALAPGSEGNQPLP